MVNHWYDRATEATLCDEHNGPAAWEVSSNYQVSCPDCWDLLTDEQRAGQLYEHP